MMIGVRSLSKSFGNVQAVADVSFDVRGGESSRRARAGVSRSWSAAR
jgi:ABC-type branched-subunit amino acid transport system ATPase component